MMFDGFRPGAVFRRVGGGKPIAICTATVKVAAPASPWREEFIQRFPSTYSTPAMKSMPRSDPILVDGDDIGVVQRDAARASRR